MATREVDGAIECWLGSDEAASTNRFFRDAAHSDFWRATPQGRLFVIRGYQEDAQETFPPGTIMDTTLPIWRMGEALLHAEKFAALMRGVDHNPLPCALFRFKWPPAALLGESIGGHTDRRPCSQRG